MYYDDMVDKKIFPRILEGPQMSFFLFGPRGTGKSTWLKDNFSDAYTIDLLNEGLYQSFLADVSLFAAELRVLQQESIVVVDEIQRLPTLLNEVHRHIEDRGLRFILCGSSARKLKREGTNLLGGRATRRTMHPLMPQEMGGHFDLDEALQWGTLPVVWNSQDRKETLSAYAQMYLREEIQAEAIVRNLPGFARFLPVAALFHGQVLNVSSLARDAGVARTTVSGYLEIIEDTLMAFRLPAYEKRLRVRERKHPKLYWTDAGICRALKRQWGTPAYEEKGSLLEGWVAGVLRAYRDYRELFHDWYYWASPAPSNVEVDFVLQRGEEIVAVEVKSKHTLARRDLRGLKAVEDLPGVVRRVVVYLGERHMATEDGIEFLPIRDFLDVVESSSLFNN